MTRMLRRKPFFSSPRPSVLPSYLVKMSSENCFVCDLNLSFVNFHLYQKKPEFKVLSHIRLWGNVNLYKIGFRCLLVTNLL